MAALLRDDPEGAPPPAPGPSAFYVRGVRYRSSAAKFWPRLLAETREMHPTCDRIELIASTGSELTGEMLYPEIALQKDIRRLLTSDLDEAMRSLIAEMEVLGPPGSVTLRLLAGERELLRRDLPLDCMDAEIFPHLVVWPLEWAGVPRERWNEERVAGAFEAEDRDSRAAYRLLIQLESRHISEGLYRRTLSVRFETLPSPAAGAANTTAP